MVQGMAGKGENLAQKIMRAQGSHAMQWRTLQNNEGIDLLPVLPHLEQHTLPKRMPMGQFLKTEIHRTQGLPCQWTFQDCQHRNMV